MTTALTGKLIGTGAGARCMVNGAEGLKELDLKVLVIATTQQPTMSELTTLVRKDETGYYTPFLDVKYVAKSVSKLISKGYLQYEEPKAEESVETPRHVSKRKRFRHGA